MTTRDLQVVLRDWEAVIGLEVHAELTTLNTKMFCSCPIEFGAPPNTHVCPVCLGMPGALPVPNRAAIESIVLAGLATDCEIMKRSMFYRKNYFYPDMSKNFQTTQGPIAFCMNGGLDLEVCGNAAQERAVLEDTRPTSSGDGYVTRVGITRIHMEEDAGKTIHIGGTDGRITGAAFSLVDYNRAGTPLIELVTEPDLRTPEEARLFLQKLRQIYLTLAISDCSMEEGSLRCDGNVSLRPRGSAYLGTKTELKNMNSFKNLHDGLAFEICRQAEVLEGGGTVLQETRHWEPASKRTVTMRVKETADDYRLFPEPDLAPYDLSDEFVEGVRARLPELPDAKKRRYLEVFGLPFTDAANLAGDVELSGFFDASMGMDAPAGSLDAPASVLVSASDLATVPASVLAPTPVSSLTPASSTPASVLAPTPVSSLDQTPVPAPSSASALAFPLARPIANLLLNDVTACLNANNTTLTNSGLTPQGIADLARLVSADVISSRQAKEVLALMVASGEAPSDIVEKHGMRQVSDSEALEAVIEEVIAANPNKVAEYRGGKVGLLGFFVGQVMKATRGQGNPRLINEILQKHLDR
jgi:aspartyl-tRNA(Asn)/glutamyl-tRNA(Gln) amidotransferase subunit B